MIMAQRPKKGNPNNNTVENAAQKTPVQNRKLDQTIGKLLTVLQENNPYRMNNVGERIEITDNDGTN